MIPVVDLQKNKPVPWEEFVKEFGEPEIRRLPESDSGWRIVRLEIDRGGASSAKVTVLNQEGQAVAGRPVAFYWADADPDPGSGPAGGVLPTMRPGRCLRVQTKEDGAADLSMGHGAYYFAPKIGPHAAWCYGQHEPSEVILGLGMLGGTEHWHYNLVFQWAGPVETPGEEPIEPPGQGETPEHPTPPIPGVPPDQEPGEAPSGWKFPYAVKFPVPTVVSGFPVSNRGVHWGTNWYHVGEEGPKRKFWLRDWQFWTEWARSMHLSWAIVLSEGDSALLPYSNAGNRSAVQVLLDAGIIPIVRFPSNLPSGFPHGDHVKTLIAQVRAYNVPAYILLGNEFGDPREWERLPKQGKKKGKGDKERTIPKDWMEVAFGWWIRAARVCLGLASELGHPVLVGFPDGPDYPDDPFKVIKGLPERGYIQPQDREDFVRWWKDGKVFYAGHFYGLNRPPDYPDDPVSREGMPLTEDQHRTVLGKFYESWKAPLELINQVRQKKAWAKQNKPRPELTACWRSWERAANWMTDHFGTVLPMALTEGGWTPGAIAGTGPETIDDRWPKPTPEVVADYTLYAMNEEKNPIFALCPWTAADSQMEGPTSWEGDAWRTHHYVALGYGPDMPVVQKLRDNPPPG